MTDKLPTADEMLNFLQAKTTEGHRWVCRISTRGRGWRVHEIPPGEITAANMFDTYPTVRQAIAAAMGVKIEPPAGR